MSDDDPGEVVRVLLARMQGRPLELRRIASFIGMLLREPPERKTAELAPEDAALYRRIEHILDRGKASWRNGTG